MRIIFYTNNSDSNELNKNINLVTELNCNVNRDNLDILSPILFLSYFDIKELNINYCYIEELNRYYFINSYTIEKNNLIKLQLETDVLMTFKNDILLSSGIVKETKNNQNNFSSQFELLDTKQQKILYFSDGDNKFTEDKLYLTGAN